MTGERPPSDAGAPLAGVRVIDISVALAGPLAAQLLGHFGADVIKVESPEGDIARGAGGGSRSPGMNPFVLHTNRDKRSLVLDLKQPEGVAALQRLLVDADVFVHNLRPAAIARLGLTHAAVAAINPRIIYCAVAGFGSRGRYAGLPAYDDIIQGAVGLPALLMRMNGGRPALVPSAICDRVTGMSAYGQIVTALFARSRDGRGRAIEVPMFETMAHLVLSDHLFLKTFVPPLGDSGHFRLLDPNRRPHATANGHLCVLPTHDRHWRKLFELAGQPELVADERFIDMRSRMRNVAALNQVVADAMRARSTAEWLALLRAADIPAMPVNSIDELIADPHLADVGMLREHAHPSEGRLVDIDFPGDWTDWHPGPGRPAPRLGEHSRAVLAEAGYASSDIDALMACGASVE